MHRYNRSQLGYCAPAALLLAAMSTDASATTFPTEKRYINGPLHICDQGSFFVGGVPKVTEYAEEAEATDPRQITIGQMYVQFQIPFHRRGWPLIHVHGSTHTGAALEATPDGREGWLPYGVRHGIASYVVDQSGRGRSGFDHSVIHEAVRTGDLDLIPTFGRISDQRAWTAWFGHLLPEGSTILDGTLIRHGDPGDPPDDDDRHPDSYFPAYPIPPVPNSVDPDIEAREGAIGPDINPRTIPIWPWSITSSWSRTARPRSRAPSAPAATRRRSRRRTPGPRATWRPWSKASTAPSSPPIRSRGTWGITWPASSRSGAACNC
jgi:hypothetical protein